MSDGEDVSFKIKTDAVDYRIDIYRMGYYGGNGARKVATIGPLAQLPQVQPPCLTNAATGLVDCGNWAESARWQVPPSAVSGIYFARLVRTDTGGDSHVFFVVRDDDGGSDLLFQTSDTTWQAYNRYGGNSLYVGSPAGRAYKVSYNRPFTTRGFASPSFVWEDEYPMVRWLERNGYDVSYFSGIDTERRGRRAPRARGLPLRRPRRVLVGRAADERRERPRRRRQPCVLQLERGLLEDEVGELDRRHRDAPPDAGLLQGDSRRREDRSHADMDGNLARRALQPAR